MPSALEELAAGIMGGKVEAAKKAGLKPTTAEAARAAVYDTHAPFPYDQLDMIEGALREVIRQAEFVLNGLGMVREAQPVAEDAQKAKEKAADEAAAERDAIQAVEAAEEPFDDRLARLGEDAQTATFTSPPADPDSGWTCPTHGSFVEKLSRKGRTFRECPEGDDFERLA